MNYRDLLNSGANVSVTVKLEDLKELFKEVSNGQTSLPKDIPSEEFLSRKEVLNILMEDENIETTRIYLRRSSTEQQEIVDRVITW